MLTHLHIHTTLLAETIWECLHQCDKLSTHSQLCVHWTQHCACVWPSCVSTENSTVQVCDRHARWQSNANIIATTETVKVVCKLGGILLKLYFLVNCGFRFPISQKCFLCLLLKSKVSDRKGTSSFTTSAVSLRFMLGPVVLILVTAGSQGFVETLSLVSVCPASARHRSRSL